MQLQLLFIKELILAYFSAQRDSLTSRLGPEQGCCSCSVLHKGTEDSLSFIYLKKNK